MNLKVYAKSRKLTLKQANDLCKLVLGQTPTTLTEEEISHLDAAASAAAEQVAAALPAADTPEDETTEAELQAEATINGAEITDPVTDNPTQEETNTQIPSDSTSLVNSNGNGITPQTREVIEILGEETLKRNVAIFMTHHIRSLQKLSQTHTAILHKFEQNIYEETSATFERMTRNLDQGFNTAQRIGNPKAQEDEQLYQDYLSLVNDFLSLNP